MLTSLIWLRFTSLATFSLRSWVPLDIVLDLHLESILAAGLLGSTGLSFLLHLGAVLLLPGPSFALQYELGISSCPWALPSFLETCFLSGGLSGLHPVVVAYLWHPCTFSHSGWTCHSFCTPSQSLGNWLCDHGVCHIGCTMMTDSVITVLCKVWSWTLFLS